MSSLRFIFKYVTKHKKYLVLSITSMLIYVSLNLLVPLILREIIDNAILNKNYNYLLFLSLSIVLISIGSSIFSYARRFFLQLLGQKVIFDVRNDLYNHVLKLSFSFFDKEETGQIMSRITMDVENLRMLIAMGFVMILSALLTIGSSVYVMFMLSVELTFVSILPFPLLS